MPYKKVTVTAPADVALVKYWGKKDEVLRLPENGSLSLTLAALTTTTTVEFQEALTADEVVVEGEQLTAEVNRVTKHLDRVRKRAGITAFAKVVSENSFPRATGLSSSSSAFAALSIAAARSAGLELDDQELSILARQGSGSACRCVVGGIVEWLNGDSSDSSYAETIFPAEHWDIRDVIAIVDEGRKNISSSEGHESARSSPFYQARLAGIAEKILAVKNACNNRDFAALGEVVEAEALNFHAILLTSTPSLIAWYPGTIQVMLAVRQLRTQGIPAYFTINTGFNVHVLTLPEYESQVQAELASLPLVTSCMVSGISTGPVVETKHLF